MSFSRPKISVNVRRLSIVRFRKSFQVIRSSHLIEPFQAPHLTTTYILPARPRITVKKVSARRIPRLNIRPLAWHPAWMAVSVLMFLSFAAGMITVWQTQLSSAGTDDPSLFSGQSSGGLVKYMQNNSNDLNVVADMLPTLIEANRHEPTPGEVASKERKDKLRAYLSSKRSPLATDEAALDALLASNNLEMILAISFVEGNFCRHNDHYNCSGIGGNNIVKYKGFADWVRDFDNLLEKRYKGLKVEQFIGYYVVPGSDNWKNGVYQVLDELKDKDIK